MSVDQIVLGQSGMVPQSSEFTVNERFTGVTVFVDNHTDFVYIHLMKQISVAKTMEAKHDFERKMYQHGIKVQKY